MCSSFSHVTTERPPSSAGTSDRTRAFGTFPGNYVAPVWLSLTSHMPTSSWTQKRPNSPLLPTPPKEKLWHCSYICSFHYSPHSKFLFAFSHTHFFTLFSQNIRNVRGTVCGLSPSCTCLCVCVLQCLIHMPFEGEMLMLLFQMQRMVIFVPQLFAAAGKITFFSSEQRESPDIVWCCI